MTDPPPDEDSTGSEPDDGPPSSGESAQPRFVYPDPSDGMLQIFNSAWSEEEMADESRWNRRDPFEDEIEDPDEDEIEDKPQLEDTDPWTTDKTEYAATVTMPDGTRRKLTRARLKPVAGAVLAAAAAVGGFMVVTDGSGSETQGVEVVEIEPVEEPVEAVEIEPVEESAGVEGDETAGLLTTDELDDLTAEELDEIVGSPEFFECPVAYQLDIIGRLLSGVEGEQSEDKAVTPEQKAANLICIDGGGTGSYVFRMIVEGDGETLSKVDGSFYEVRFIVNNEWPNNVFYDDTGFEVFVGWNHLAQQYGVTVSDSQRTRIGDAEVEVEWLDPSTMQVHIVIPGHDVEVVEMRTELNMYAFDENDVNIYWYDDVAIWNADQ